MKLWAENIAGNLHNAVSVINGVKFWVHWRAIIAMESTGNITVVVFLVSDEEYDKLRARYHAPRPGLAE